MKQSYQEEIKQFAIYHNDVEQTYLTLGLFAEVGEVVGVIAKSYRDGTNPRDKLILEIGDCFWFISMIHSFHGETFDDSETVYGDHDFSDLEILSDLEDLYFFSDSFFASEQAHDVLRLLMITYKITMAEVLQANLDKLYGRQARGTIKGDGDNR